MTINFYEEGLKTKMRLPRNADAILNSFSEDEKIKIAVSLGRWEWDENLLGKFPGAALARGYESIFRGDVGEYKLFKYALKQQGKSDKEINEAIIERIFNIVTRR